MTTKIQQTTLFLTLFVILFASLGLSVVSAANHLVTPMVINLELEKRDIISDTVTVTNTSQRQVRVYASVNNVAMNGGVVDTFQQQVEVDNSNTATSWIEISRKRITLAPGEVLEVPFTVRMNPLTQPGDYNVFIGFAEAANRPGAEKKVANGDAPGTIVHISVDQTQNQFLRLEQFSVDKFITTDDAETLSFTLTNPGGVDIVPSGEVIFYDNNGAEINSLPINTNNKKVPANGEASFLMDVPKELTLGKYKAFLSVEFGEHLTASVHDTAFFYILPIKQLIIIFAIVLFFAILIALFVHRRYDIGDDGDGSENVTMYIREGQSDDQHHDIDLSNKNSKNDEA